MATSSRHTSSLHMSKYANASQASTPSRVLFPKKKIVASWQFFAPAKNFDSALVSRRVLKGLSYYIGSWIAPAAQSTHRIDRHRELLSFKMPLRSRKTQKIITKPAEVFVDIVSTRYSFNTRSGRKLAVGVGAKWKKSLPSECFVGKFEAIMGVGRS